jgi:CRP/FNR family cyclic AMP-dependent transcriptional regulator
MPGVEHAAVEFVKRASLFAGLPPAVAAKVTRECRVKPVALGQTVFTEGESCEDLYILVDGRVACYRANTEGREQVLRTFAVPGDTFCLTSAFNLGRHVVSARAERATKLYAIKVPTISRLALENPPLAMALLAAASSQTGDLLALAEDLALRTVLARLAKLLLKRAHADGTPTGKSLELSRQRFREEEVASTVGTVRVHVSRSLKQLVRLGAVRLSRNTIVIPDPGVLERFCEEGASPSQPFRNICDVADDVAGPL